MHSETDIPDIDALLAQCRSEDPVVPCSAIRALERTLERANDTRPDVIVELVSLAENSKHDRVREAAVRALGVVTPPECYQTVVPLLIACSHADDSLIRAQAVQSLGMLGDCDVSARQRLELVLRQDADWVVRATAAEALGERGDGAALPTLMDAAREDEYYPVRTYAIGSIARLGGAATLSFLRARLAVEAHPQTRNELVEHALRFGDHAVFDELLDLLATDDWELGVFPVDSVDRLLSDGPPAILRERAHELDRALAGLAERVGGHEEWHGVGAYIDEVRARVHAGTQV